MNPQTTATKSIEDRVKIILLQFSAEQRQGLNELAGHGTAIEQGTRQILQLIEDRQNAIMEILRTDSISTKDYLRISRKVAALKEKSL